MKYFKYLGILLISLFFVNNVKALDIPTADVTYDYEWIGTLIIDADQTIKISDINHDNRDTTYDAVIKITNNANVNLVFEGDNILVANPVKECAGIEVEEGSTINIYGLEGASLTVTGGKNSAGIGGKGDSGVSVTNPKAGNINIYSGNITAIGGMKGAGIGSGFHSSASNINILGGNIEAYGTGGGAGIGSGYGTSGGAAYDYSGVSTGAGVGFYNGGNITISGDAQVKAVAYHFDFDSFDPYNLDTLYGFEYENTFAAGIGGGYGSSSGSIVIEGNADVLAIGSSGGAGIGSGRGTSKINNYDDEHFNVNITIKDDVKVMAFATNDTRGGQTLNSGAAIGLGLGTTLEGEPKGSVSIIGNASVYAVSSNNTQAIGASRVVGILNTNDIITIGEIDTLKIDSTAKVVAVSDGSIDAMDRDKVSNFISLNIDKSLFEENASFFKEDKFPLIIEITDKDAENNKALFAIQKPEDMQVMFNIGATNNNLIVKDYLLDEQKVYLANEVELDMSNFISGDEVTIYNPTVLTTRLLEEVEVETEYGNLSIGIYANEGIFESGSTFHAETIKDERTLEELRSNIDDKENLAESLFFDLGVAKANGIEYDRLSGKIRIRIEIPNGWDTGTIRAVYVTDGEDEDVPSRLEKINGKTYISFTVPHFSNYGLLLYKAPVQAAANTNPTTNTVENPNTSDNINTYIILLIISLMSLVGIKVLKENI